MSRSCFWRVRKLCHSSSKIQAPVQRSSNGFDLHAGLVVPAGQRERLERVRRYALRPPVAADRLRVTDDGQEAAVIDRILRHLGLPSETPAPRPAPAPPRLVDVLDAAGWADDASVFIPCS